MSQRPTLDPSSFERLLAAAWVLQRQHEQEARNRRPAPGETRAEIPETHVAPNCVSEHDTTSARLMAALSKLSQAAEAGGNPNATLAHTTALNGIEQLNPALVVAEETAAPERKKTSRIKVQESFRAARLRSVFRPLVGEKWGQGSTFLGHCLARGSQALRRAHSWLLSNAISAAGSRQHLQAEFAGRYLSEAPSFLWVTLKNASQELRVATRYRPWSGLLKKTLDQSSQSALLWLLKVAESTKSRLESFARFRAKTWVPSDFKLSSNLRRAVAAGGAPLLILLNLVAFTLLEVWPHEQFDTVAAMSRMNHPPEENAVRKAEQSRSIPPVQGSHMQVTDPVVWTVVESLSRYEIRGLRRQADYGDDSAALTMGMVYETGRYVPQSCTEAAHWVMTSANAGNAAAQYNLGLRYRDGDGLPANEDEAEKWLRKAADQGYANARVALETLTSRAARSTYAP